MQYYHAHGLDGIHMDKLEHGVERKNDYANELSRG